jgi:signal peptidase I
VGAGSLPRPSATEGDRRRARRNTVRIAFAVCLLVFAVLALSWSFRVYRVASASMEPTLHCAAAPGCKRLKDDVIVVNRFAYRLQAVRRGDIVTFRAPPDAPPRCRSSGVRVKRVAGVPGDVVRTEHGAKAALADATAVAPGHYFLLSDNLSGSCDSRELGAVPRADIIGKVILVYTPPWHLRRP